MTTQKESKPNPYTFIKRDEDNPPAFQCNHPEISGQFVPKKLTVRNKSAIKNLKGALVGNAIDVEAERLAEWQAYVTFGFEQKPEKFEVDKIYSEDLLHALYLEIVQYNEFFRRAPVEGAFSIDPA